VMKIVIGGSMVFAKEQLEAKKILEEMGYEVLVTDDIEDYVNDSNIKMNFEEELRLSLKYDIMRSFFNKIEGSDALLIVNEKKRGIEGYLGTSVLMEMGLAYHLKKKVYLVNPIDMDQGYALEVALIDPVVINGDYGLVR